MLNYRELFSTSKQSTNILIEDLNHFIKANKIFHSKKMQLALAMNHVDAISAEGETSSVSPPEQIVDYYFFYKDTKKSSKLAKKQLETD